MRQPQQGLAGNRTPSMHRSRRSRAEGAGSGVVGAMDPARLSTGQPPCGTRAILVCCPAGQVCEDPVTGTCDVTPGSVATGGTCDEDTKCASASCCASTCCAGGQDACLLNQSCAETCTSNDTCPAGCGRGYPSVGGGGTVSSTSTHSSKSPRSARAPRSVPRSSTASSRGAVLDHTGATAAARSAARCSHQRGPVASG